MINVQILGYGDEPVAGAAPAPQGSPSASAPVYDAASAVQVLGAGPLNAREAGALREDERRKLTM